MYLLAFSILLSLLYYYMGFTAYFAHKEAIPNRLFLALTILFSSWSFAGAFYNADNSLRVARFWVFHSYIIWTLGTAIILHFCLTLRSTAQRVKGSTLFALYTPAALLLFGMLTLNGLTPSYQIHLTPLRFVFGIPGGIFFYAFYISISIYNLIQMRRINTHPRFKKQSQWISSGLIATSLSIAFYGFILPPMVQRPLPVLLPFFPALWIVSMWLAITRFGFLKVTMEIATKEILDNIQEIIILADHRRVVVDVNKKFEDTVSLDKATISGQLLQELLTKNPDALDLVDKVLTRELDTFSGDLDLRFDNDRLLPARVRISPIFDATSGVMGIVIAATDLTLEKRFEQLSMTDSLTNAYNRLKMERILERLLQGKAAFSAILFDIDFFKLVNDNFGHPAGDRVLIDLVTLINRTLRAIDFIARWGGEEFLLVLTDTPEMEGFQVAERIREAVASYDFGLGHPITISLGLASYNGQPLSSNELVSRADQALYHAKQTGRNKTIRYSAMIPVESFKYTHSPVGE